MSAFPRSCPLYPQQRPRKRILGNGHVRVLIGRCRIKAAFNTSSDKGLELRVTHALHVDCGGGFELFGTSDATTRTNSTGCVHAAVISAALPNASQLSCRSAMKSSDSLLREPFRPALGIAGLARLELGQLSASDLFSTC